MGTMEREIGHFDWKGKSYEQKRLREKFGRFYRGWQAHDEGGRCVPPKSWEPASQRDYLDGYEAARRTHPERMLESLEAEDWEEVVTLDVPKGFGNATWVSRAVRVDAVTKLRRMLPPHYWVVVDIDGGSHMVPEDDIEVDRSIDRTEGKA